MWRLHNHDIVAYAMWMHEAEWIDEFRNPQGAVMPGGQSLTQPLDGGRIMAGV